MVLRNSVFYIGTYHKIRCFVFIKAPHTLQMAGALKNNIPE